MYSKQHVDEAWEENLILAQAWEDYAYELCLQGASREDIDICCDEAELHWEWVRLWQEYEGWLVTWEEYDYYPCLSEQELQAATLSEQELDALQEPLTIDTLRTDWESIPDTNDHTYEQAIDFLYACYRLTADSMADYPAYV